VASPSPAIRGVPKSGAVIEYDDAHDPGVPVPDEEERTMPYDTLEALPKGINYSGYIGH
jgi:hypothetical protein